MHKGENIMKKYASLILLFIVCLVISACGKEELVEVEEEPIKTLPVVKEIPIHVSEDEEVEEVFPYYAPLTGIGSLLPIDQRITMIIIENHSQARPQTGLDKADLVYEMLAEGGISRFAAFYQSQYPETVGPVRSIRPYFIRLSEGYDAYIVHAGWSPEAQQIILKEKLPSINGLALEPTYFWRVKDRKAPHNLYTNFNHILAAAKKLNLREESKIPTFSFLKPTDEINGENATNIKIRYSSSYSVSYAYDENTQLYVRSMNGEVHRDAATNEALTATNVMVIMTKHKVLDNEGRLFIDITSGGKGYLFQRGKAQEITWKNVDGVIYPYKDGQQLSFYPGQTWVNVVTETAPGVSYE